MKKKTKKPAQVIAVINEKGGVSKTTTTAALAGGLLLRGYAALVIDIDPQTSLTTTYNADEQQPNIYDALKARTAAGTIQTTGQGDMIAGCRDLVYPDRLEALTLDLSTLKDALQPIRNDYDFILIDTPPALSILTLNALTASTFALITAQADLHSVKGIATLNETIEDLRHSANPDLQIMGVLLTRYNPRAALNKTIAAAIDDMTKQLGTRLFKTFIRECIAIREADMNAKSIYQQAPRSNAAKDYIALTDEVLKAAKQ